MHNFLIISIMLLHLLFVLFIILVPFIGNNYFLLLHSITVPFIIIHWILNDNSCVLTQIEKQLRKQYYGQAINDNDCFTYNLVAPIYDFANNYHTFTILIYIITIMLWAISVYKLYQKFSLNEFNSFFELIYQNNY